MRTRKHQTTSTQRLCCPLLVYCFSDQSSFWERVGVSTEPYWRVEYIQPPHILCQHFKPNEPSTVSNQTSQPQQANKPVQLSEWLSRTVGWTTLQNMRAIGSTIDRSKQFNGKNGNRPKRYKRSVEKLLVYLSCIFWYLYATIKSGFPKWTLCWCKQKRKACARVVLWSDRAGNLCKSKDLNFNTAQPGLI